VSDDLTLSRIPDESSGYVVAGRSLFLPPKNSEAIRRIMVVNTDENPERYKDLMNSTRSAFSCSVRSRPKVVS
jgi:hypothetical protein